ncbi:hypothetical protein JRC04_25155 [Mycolicibacterium sp. S2-37]|uniref:DUF6779 domain-containing protein n=1 Tax=Mycolicibacterium sp. S2-37 TaxID=2810297 RepID=UPI001A94375C|nr:DUF6779 domain-containing protein [Mycolicibacterium sp. S2-37]MBO0680767.1 hypothetical protein [Mycolicibacterium sp. S2-37]
MTVLPRGSRTRRGGRRPAWVLMTVLLVLAIGASSALVFTERVELLKLAVILALWAAVVAAFVSVMYRRQSDLDQAKARDMKYVYDLQLEREISARREYELTVETQLRREIASELRAQSADEVAALRAELAALRTNLEILFDTDLAARPAIEHPGAAVHAYSGWAGDAETTGRVSSSRIDAELHQDIADEVDDRTEESPIIDVPAEPQPAEPAWTPPPPAEEAFDRGVHRLVFEEQPAQQDRPGRRRRAEEPQPEPAPGQPAYEQPDVPAAGWRPAPAEGQWIPAGVPGSNWVSPPVEQPAPPEYVGRRRAPESLTPEPEPEPPRGRHSVGASEVTDPHLAAVPAEDSAPMMGPAEETAEEARARRHHSAEETGGPSVADLLARFQATPSSGGGRRRRAE